MAVEESASSAAAGQSGVVPLTVFGLLQHEAKLSVVNFSMKKVGSYTESIKSKEDLLFVCGLRSFMAQPVLSDDGQGADKYKMDRFLQPGKTAVGSVYAPISYPPLPLLVFKVRSLFQPLTMISLCSICTSAVAASWHGLQYVRMMPHHSVSLAILPSPGSRTPPHGPSSATQAVVHVRVSNKYLCCV